METFLAVLMALGIFVAIPVIIAFAYVGIVTGLFKVLRYKARRRIFANRRMAIKVPEESLLEKVTK